MTFEESKNCDNEKYNGLSDRRANPLYTEELVETMKNSALYLNVFAHSQVKWPYFPCVS